MRRCATTATIENGRLRCSIGEYNKQPYAYPHLLSLVYRAFGVGTTPAFVVNAVAAGLAVCLVYLLVAILFEDRLAAFFAALLLALTPEQICGRRPPPPSRLRRVRAVAALLAAAWFVRSRSTASLVGAAVAAAYAIQFRPESLLIVPVIAAVDWQRAPRGIRAAAAVVGGPAVPGARGRSRRTSGRRAERQVGAPRTARMSLSYVAANLRVNGWFYLADARFPAAYTAVGACRLCFGGGPRRDVWRSPCISCCSSGSRSCSTPAATTTARTSAIRSRRIHPLVSLAGSGAAGLIRGLDSIPRLRDAGILRGVWRWPCIRLVSAGGPFDRWRRGRRAPTCVSPCRSSRTCGDPRTCSRRIPACSRCGASAPVTLARRGKSGAARRVGAALYRRRLRALEFLVQHPGSSSERPLRQGLETQTGRTCQAGVGT